MSFEWIETTLGDFINLKRGYDLPKAKRKDGTVPVISSSGYSGSHNVSMIEGPGVVTGRYGTIGEVFYIPENFWPLNTTLYVDDFKGNSPLFIYYLLQTINFHSFSDKAAVPGINRNHVHMASITVPKSKHEQEKIASVLKKLEDKISVNRRMNLTLEQMAQALFKSWFVDFEPVKAKIAVLEAAGTQEEATLAAMTVISGKDAVYLADFEREQPGKYAELRALAELFPAEMLKSKLGDIPVGWINTDLSSLALLNTSSWSKKNAPESLNYVDLANTKWGVIHSTEEFLFADAPSRARRKLKSGDTIVGTVRPGNGSYAFIDEDNLTGSTGFAVLTPKKNHFSTFIYICATSKDNIERLAHLADGGAYPAVNSDIVLATPCTIPVEDRDSEKLISAFHGIVKNLFDCKKNISLQNKSLEQLRDILLPKLISGEIDLSNQPLFPKIIMEGA